MDMTTKKFIDKARQNLFKRFPKLESCKYVFDNLSNPHYFLIAESVYCSKDFSEFDYLTTREAFELGIQGLICFMTDEKLFDFKDQQSFYNPYNNEVLHKNLVNFVDPNDFFLLSFKLNDINSSFSEEANKVGIDVAGTNNYALAA